MARPSPKLCAAATLPLLGGLLWLLAVWLTVPTLPSLAQFTPTVTMQFVTADPAGACALNVPLRYNTSNGKLWGCDALTWTLVAAGTFSGSLAGDVTGTQGATVVGKVNGKAISLANSFTTAGNFALTLTQTASTSVTLPTSGTLATNGNTPISINGYCVGTATAGATIALAGLGSGTASSTACNTGAAANFGWIAPAAGTVTAIYAFSVTGGTNASSGVLTVTLNDVAQTVTCTFGTATNCNDTGHSFAFAAGQRLGAKFTTQGSETLASVQVGIRAVLN